jgi:hypothetical protein
MDREDKAPKAGQLSIAGSIALEPLAEEWLARIRTRLPDTGTAVVTIQKVNF